RTEQSERRARGRAARKGARAVSPKKTPPKRIAAPMREQVTLEFPHNALLAGLAGTHQKHFVRLEQKLGVRLSTRGNLIGIEGADDPRARAAAVLRALYA